VKVELWQIIQDWLPIAGWEILEVRAPQTYDDFNGNTSQIPAFIVVDVEKHKHVAGTNQDHPMDKMCMINGNEVLFLDKGMWDYSVKASDPEFFEKLDKILITMFNKAEWFHKKMGWSVTGHHREKIWPK
jgi:hypothetical protein